jgi:membrane protease YdiL (CAAX protease family)
MNRVTNWAKSHEVRAYFALALAISWTLAIPLALTAGQTVDVRVPFGWHYLASLGPITAALAVTAVVAGKAGAADLLARMARWRIGLKWWLVASGSPVCLSLLAAVVARVAEGAWPNLRRVGEVTLLGDIGALAALSLWVFTFGFGEETGWRGFALARLQRRHLVATATALVAVIWAVWHVPYWFYLPGYLDLGIAGAPGFFVGLLLGAIVMTWLYTGTGGSIAAVAVWHALFDFFSGSQARNG